MKDCFITEIEFKNESFIYKALTCLCSLINKDNSMKPWNKKDEFDSYIAPKKNMSLSMKDHRFNRLLECCIFIVYHMDDICGFLDKHNDIMNNLAILNRTFVNMEILKPIFCAVAWIGIQYTRPFLALMKSPSTEYSDILYVFPTLYKDFNITVTKDMLYSKA